MCADSLRVLGYRARAPSGLWLYWCGACWLVLSGCAEFLLPADPAASEPIMADSPLADRPDCRCHACRRHLFDGDTAGDE